MRPGATHVVPSQKQTIRAVAYLFAHEPGQAGGGSQVRAESLVAELRRRGVPATLELVEVPAGIRRRTNQAVGVAKGIPPTFARLDHRALDRRFEQASQAGALVVAGTLWLSAAMTPRMRSQSVLDAHNVESDVYRQAAVTVGGAKGGLYRATARWMTAFEQRTCRQHCAVWAVSEADADWYRNRGASQVDVVQNGCSLPGWPVRESLGHSLVFVGSMQTAFNREGIAWFVRECWPVIRSRLPDAELVLAGRGGEEFRRDGIRALGFVPDVRTALVEARAAIAPILSGGGSRLKVPEALAWGLPTVTTTVGAAGHNLSLQDGVLFADDAETFARSCIRLLTDPAQAEALGQQARSAAEKRLSWGVAGEQAIKALGARLGRPCE